MALGVCFNDRCSFAHGTEELREIDRVPPAAWAGTSLQAARRSAGWLQPLLFSEVTFLLQPSGWCWFIGNIVGRADFWTSSLRSAWFPNLVPGLVK